MDLGRGRPLVGGLRQAAHHQPGHLGPEALLELTGLDVRVLEHVVEDSGGYYFVRIARFVEEAGHLHRMRDERGLAVELAPHGIRVNAIAPGYVETAMTAELHQDEARRAEVISRIPLGRFAEPEEMAPAAVFLLSPLAGYITGEVLHVDGGYVAR